MCEQSLKRRNDLWITVKAFDQCPEENLRLWENTAAFVEGLGAWPRPGTKRRAYATRP